MAHDLVEGFAVVAMDVVDVVEEVVVVKCQAFFAFQCFNIILSKDFLRQQCSTFMAPFVFQALNEVAELRAYTFEENWVLSTHIEKRKKIAFIRYVLVSL